MVWQSPNGKLLYRVGDILISTNSQNPSAWFGGTWKLLCPGRTLVCIDTSDGDFNTVKKTGGSKYLQSHNHTSDSAGWHNHTGTCGNAGDHTHTLPFNEYRFTSIAGSDYALAYVADSHRPANKYSYSAGSHSHSIGINGNGTHTHSISSSGNGNAQNLQPYMAVYMWVRTA